MLLVLAVVVGAAIAQSPIVVQAASALPAATAAPMPQVQEFASTDAQIKQLEQMKSANEDILSRQKAALERLDEIQQAAQELKTFAQRG
jgi:hypothetical protein